MTNRELMEKILVEIKEVRAEAMRLRKEVASLHSAIPLSQPVRRTTFEPAHRPGYPHDIWATTHHLDTNITAAPASVIERAQRLLSKGMKTE